MKTTVQKAIVEALEKAGIAADDVEVQAPKEESHGDLASPVAMGLAGKLKRPPRDIASEIAGHILKNHAETFENVEVAGPGFLNFTFTRNYLYGGIGAILAEGDKRFLSDVGSGTRVQVEFVSANPTGPLHLGHGRGAAIGCALSNLLKAAGYEVEREYYVNDAGRQVQLLGESVFARYKELIEIDHEFPEEGYRGDYIIDTARTIHERVDEKYRGATFEEEADFFIDSSLELMLEMIKRVLEDFSVSFDVWQSERALHDEGTVKHTIDFLRDKELIFEKDGATWFRSSKFGDDKDRVVIKADGGHTYFASDIAYHLKKVERGFDEIINIWGADHHGYVPRLEAVMDALGPGRRHLAVLLVQMVSLLRGGEPVQMSKRSGEFVTLREVIEEVGADTTKFIFLTRRHDSQLAFDLEVAKAESSENPVYYIQYAGARISSIFRKAGEEGVPTDGLEQADLSPLTEDEELRLIRKLLMYPMTLEAAALAREPHRLTFYLQELAGLFHPFYKRHRVLTDDAALTRARLALCESVRIVLRHALGILGISAPERM
jgi:arginyl-tRNA synthetase